ncbi:MAG TPA: AMP-binding protein, partial [Ramlibacter sp.]|nr:AMP-binding protein [Ramlibacter sp.]
MPQLTRHHAHWPTGVPHTLDVPERNIFDHLPQRAELHPERTAIDYYGRPTTYRALHDGAVALAGYLQQHLEVRRGDRVLLVMQPCPQFAMAYYAILRCDAVVVALSPMSTDAELRYYASDSGARVAIAMQDFLPRLRPLLDDGALEGVVAGAYSELSGRPEDVPFMTIPEFVLAPREPDSHPQVHDFMGALAADIAPL